MSDEAADRHDEAAETNDEATKTKDEVAEANDEAVEINEEEARAPDWPAANQRYLMAALELVRLALVRQVEPASAVEADADEARADERRRAERALAEAAAALPAPAALEELCALFGLTRFERDVLLLCAGVELDAGFARLCAAAQTNAQRGQPTFGLALALLPEADWQALSPARPLRYWRLVEVGAGAALTQSSLRIDERVLHYLAGVYYWDERLAGVVAPLGQTAPPVASHRALAERIAAIWAETYGTPDFPVIQLCGEEVEAKRAIAAEVCALLELAPGLMPAAALHVGAGELDALLRAWEREAVLGRAALVLDCDEAETPDATRDAGIARVIDNATCPLIITSRQRQRQRRRPMLTFDVGKPTVAEQRAIWRDALGPDAAALNGQVEQLVAQFNLAAPAIRAACAGALGGLALDTGAEPQHGEERRPTARQIGRALWDTCRAQARPRLEDLAQRIEPAAVWDELVLPDGQKQVLREIVGQVRNRARVYEGWGFAARSARGLGISALFSGASGTGKTMAAEVIAHELRLDLYRIDLSAVVSKYIGETEKNLRRVFDTAEEGGAILLFDEADALFGKRSEVKDSHDRHANIEVSYLLQRMEAYRGLAVLTTNMREALDAAFLRRIRFVVQFPFPDSAQRAEIWRRVFPAQTPTENLDAQKLARLNVPGGNIRNIALGAAFLAAEAGEPVRMAHLLHAARGEYAKLEKTLSESEIRGWVD